MSLIKRSLSLYGHSTSLALETEYWAVIDYIATRDARSVASLIKILDDRRIAENYARGLAAYIRVWAIGKIIADDAIRDSVKSQFSNFST